MIRKLRPPRLDEVDERTQRSGYQASTGVVEERAGEAQPPWLEDGLELAAVEMRAQPVLKQIHDADAGNRCVDREVDRSANAHQQRPGRIDLHHLALALELP